MVEAHPVQRGFEVLCRRRVGKVFQVVGYVVPLLLDDEGVPCHAFEELTADYLALTAAVGLCGVDEC